MGKFVAVIGSRGFDDYAYFKLKIAYLLSNITTDIVFVSGAAISGADKLVKKYAEEYKYEIIEFPPQYDKYPYKVAPIKRNDQIVEKADVLIAFWDGKSKGTKYTIERAYKKGMPVRIIEI